VIIIIMIQAYLSEANVNWALAAMPALVVWLAGWLAGWLSSGVNLPTRRRLGVAALAINIALSFTILAVTLAGSLGPLTPDSDPLRRQRGWHQLTTDSAAALARHDATTLIADRRASAALLSWHFHGTGIDVLIRDEDGVPSNHFEQNLVWTRQPGRRVIGLGDNVSPPAMEDVTWVTSPPALISTAEISHNRTRRLYLHQGVEAD
jgi:hypothetical protein